MEVVEQPFRGWRDERALRARRRARSIGLAQNTGVVLEPRKQVADAARMWIDDETAASAFARSSSRSMLRSSSRSGFLRPRPGRCRAGKQLLNPRRSHDCDCSPRPPSCASDPKPRQDAWGRLPRPPRVKVLEVERDHSIPACDAPCFSRTFSAVNRNDSRREPDPDLALPLARHASHSRASVTRIAVPVVSQKSSRGRSTGPRKPHTKRRASCSLNRNPIRLPTV